MMIVIDTNVASEPSRPDPDARVLSWLDAAASELWVTFITLEETEFGWLLMPPGRRRDEIGDHLGRLRLWDRVLDGDRSAAAAAATVRARRRAAGRPISYADALIAGICLSRGAALATRNVDDFDGLGLELINPWEDA